MIMPMPSRTEFLLHRLYNLISLLHRLYIQWVSKHGQNERGENLENPLTHKLVSARNCETTCFHVWRWNLLLIMPMPSRTEFLLHRLYNLISLLHKLYIQWVSKHGQNGRGENLENPLTHKLVSARNCETTCFHVWGWNLLLIMPMPSRTEFLLHRLYNLISLLHRLYIQWVSKHGQNGRGENLENPLTHKLVSARNCETTCFHVWGWNLLLIMPMPSRTEFLKTGCITKFLFYTGCIFNEFPSTDKLEEEKTWSQFLKSVNHKFQHMRKRKYLKKER